MYLTRDAPRPMLVTGRGQKVSEACQPTKKRMFFKIEVTQ